MCLVISHIIIILIYELDYSKAVLVALVMFQIKGCFYYTKICSGKVLAICY